MLSRSCRDDACRHSRQTLRKERRPQPRSRRRKRRKRPENSKREARAGCRQFAHTHSAAKFACETGEKGRKTGPQEHLAFRDLAQQKRRRLGTRRTTAHCVERRGESLFEPEQSPQEDPHREGFLCPGSIPQRSPPGDFCSDRRRWHSGLAKWRARQSGSAGTLRRVQLRVSEGRTGTSARRKPRSQKRGRRRPPTAPSPVRSHSLTPFEHHPSAGAPGSRFSHRRGSTLRQPSRSGQHQPQQQARRWPKVHRTASSEAATVSLVFKNMGGAPNPKTQGVRKNALSAKKL